MPSIEITSVVLISLSDPKDQPMTVFDRVSGMLGLLLRHNRLTTFYAHGQPMDFTCVETQIGNGSKADCEIVELNGTKGVYKLVIPTF
jgi:hypothetical protein